MNSVIEFCLYQNALFGFILSILFWDFRILFNISFNVLHIVESALVMFIFIPIVFYSFYILMAIQVINSSWL